MSLPTPPPKSEPPRARRWSGSRSKSASPYRLVFRLVGIPIIALSAVFLYRGVRDHLELPACDSETAKQTLSEVLKELKLEPVRYEPIKTISSNNDEVVCNAVMPLPGGGNVVADYSFSWQGSKASMRYSIHRQAPQNS